MYESALRFGKVGGVQMRVEGGGEVNSFGFTSGAVGPAI